MFEERVGTCFIDHFGLNYLLLLVFSPIFSQKLQQPVNCEKILNSSIFSPSLDGEGRGCQACCYSLIWNYSHCFLMMSVWPGNAAWCQSPGPLAEPWKPDVICLRLNIPWDYALVLQDLHPALACLYLLFTLEQIKNTSAENCKHPIWYWFYTSHGTECTSSSRCRSRKPLQLAEDKQTAIAWRCTSSFSVQIILKAGSLLESPAVTAM